MILNAHTVLATAAYHSMSKFISVTKKNIPDIEKPNINCGQISQYIEAGYFSVRALAANIHAVDALLDSAKLEKMRGHYGKTSHALMHLVGLREAAFKHT
jgi:hypothetical protein